MDQLLARIAQSLSSSKSLEQLTRTLLELLEEVSGFESTYLTQIDFGKNVQHVLFSRNSARLTIPEGLSVAWGDTLCKRALDDGLRYAADVSERWGDSAAARDLGIKTYTSVPVRTGDGALYGTLCAASANALPLSDEAMGIFDIFSMLIAQFVERDRLVQDLRDLNARLSSMAMTDWLTGLPNRRALTDDLARLLAQARRAHRRVLIAYADLDDFKTINDKFGHEVGDQFLRLMAQRLTGALREGDMLARLGGDEFIVVGEGPVSSEHAAGAAEALRARISAASTGQFELAAVILEYPGASVGVVNLDPSSVDVDGALREADRAMYHVKQSRQRDCVGIVRVNR